MTKYFAKDAFSSVEHGVKFKSGQIVDLSPDTAKMYNGLKPGLLEEYVPEKHTPAPKEDVNVEEVKAEEVKEPVKDEAKAEKPKKAKKEVTPPEASEQQ